MNFFELHRCALKFSWKKSQGNPCCSPLLYRFSCEQDRALPDLLTALARTGKTKLVYSSSMSLLPAELDEGQRTLRNTRKWSNSVEFSGQLCSLFLYTNFCQKYQRQYFTLEISLLYYQRSRVPDFLVLYPKYRSLNIINRIICSYITVVSSWSDLTADPALARLDWRLSEVPTNLNSPGILSLGSTKAAATGPLPAYLTGLVCILKELQEAKKISRNKLVVLPYKNHWCRARVLLSLYKIHNRQHFLQV